MRVKKAGRNVMSAAVGGGLLQRKQNNNEKGESSFRKDERLLETSGRTRGSHLHQKEKPKGGKKGISNSLKRKPRRP